MNKALNILVENAKTFKERNEIFALTEAELNNVNNELITKLYKSVIDKAHIDFDNIPLSKGDITKYSGYNSMVETLRNLEILAEKSNTKIKEIEVINKALSNLVAYKNQFERGFALGKDFIILLYNNIVAACVESTSCLIASYVDYVRTVDKVEFTIIKGNVKNNRWGVSLNSLTEFNKTASNGDLNKVLNTIIKTGNEQFIGAEVLAVPIFIIGGVIALVLIIRQLVFKFFYARMKISEYLKQQSYFLEINRNSVEANGTIPINKRKEIIKKQDELSKKLMRLSDKIAVDSDMSDTKSIDIAKNETKSWSLDDMKSNSASTDSNGFQLL